MAYELALATTSEELEELVNHMIDDGYKPQGGVAISSSGEYTQAMVSK